MSVPPLNIYCTILTYYMLKKQKKYYTHLYANKEGTQQINLTLFSLQSIYKKTGFAKLLDRFLLLKWQVNKI